MNKIEFVLRTADIENHSYNYVDILIDKRSIIELLEEYELPFSQKEGLPDTAGGYLGLSPKSLYHQLIRNINEGWPTGKRNLLTCADCLEDGCWPMLITIEESDDRIILKDFEQPHRSKDSNTSYWDYSKFGPFMFNKSEYKKELKRLRNMIK